MEDVKDLNNMINLSGNTVSADTFVDFLGEENTDSMTLGACADCEDYECEDCVEEEVVDYVFDIYVEDAETGEPLDAVRVLTTAGVSGYTNVYGLFSWFSEFEMEGITVSKPGWITYSGMAYGDGLTSISLHKDEGESQYCTAAVYISTPIKGIGNPSASQYNISKNTAVLLTNYSILTQFFGGTMLTYQGQSYTAIFLNSEGKCYRNVVMDQVTNGGCFTIPATQKVILMADGHRGQILSDFKFTVTVSAAGYPAPVYSASTTTTAVLPQLMFPVTIEDEMWGPRITATCNGVTKRASMGGSYDDCTPPQVYVHCSGTSVDLTIDRMGYKSASITATRSQYGAFNDIHFNGNTFTKTSDWDRLATPPLISSGTGWVDYAVLANGGFRCETFDTVLQTPYGEGDFESYPESLGRVTSGSRCITIGEFVPNVEYSSAFMSGGDNYLELFF